VVQLQQSLVSAVVEGCGPQIVPLLVVRVAPVGSAQLVEVVVEAVIVALAVAPLLDVDASPVSVVVVVVAPASLEDAPRPRLAALPPQPMPAAGSTPASASHTRRAEVF